MRVIALLALAASAVAVAVPVEQAHSTVATALDAASTHAVDLISTELAKLSRDYPQSNAITNIDNLDSTQLPPNPDSSSIEQLAHANDEPVCGTAFSMIQNKWLSLPMHKGYTCHNVMMKITMYYNTDCGVCRWWS
ncbi:uncharacterized protein EI97DRAFT_147392 [Westerdykella ornata]|uniref:SCP domain-containing protein n=1 Tax=Westerdykella ornata TaxID=318751 RepID=A0A6A6JAK1_WESOR|nr:uncharacterized protein EI97DRAFT_147392 [Westerdykella ornata]KAF2273621.1 hypothetical protein EI97DRAFT_147392 [Westerdykella ornata]